jgi:hypothetical protein
VVLSGDSAGGLSTFLHLDRLKTRLPAGAFLVGKPKAGFFLDYKASGVSECDTYPSFMRHVFEMQNSTGSLSQECQVCTCFIKNIVTIIIATQLHHEQLFGEALYLPVSKKWASKLSSLH